MLLIAALTAFTTTRWLLAGCVGALAFSRAWIDHAMATTLAWLAFAATVIGGSRCSTLAHSEHLTPFDQLLTLFEIHCATPTSRETAESSQLVRTAVHAVAQPLTDVEPACPTWSLSLRHRHFATQLACELDCTSPALTPFTAPAGLLVVLGRVWAGASTSLDPHRFSPIP